MDIADGRVVLVVDHDGEQRREIVERLMRHGYIVLSCPGPEAPRFACPASSGADCPLASLPKVVVVNLRLGTDVMMTGIPGWQLMLYYLDRGMRVIALSGEQDAVHPLGEDGVTVLPRPIDPDQIVAAVRQAFSAPRLRELAAG